MSEVHLRLAPRRGLEAALEGGGLGRRPDGAQEVGHRGVAAGEAEFADLPPEPPARQVGEAPHPLAQEGLEGTERRRGRAAGLVGRRLQAALDVFADGLAVVAGAAGDGRDGQALPGEVQDHDELPKGDHQPLPRCRSASSGMAGAARARGRGPERGQSRWTGEFSASTSGEDSLSRYTRPP
eukprot:GHVU01136728.1.p1 GENE.GHVU01136728.1~~GHVU01136728.1.p1  ORF type:complete len:211 (-),score=13.97 GHVU01136728.1:30-575(-)